MAAVYSVLGPGGYPRPPYGSFAGKIAAIPGRTFTQTFSVLGPGAYPRPPYGSFAGKVASVTPPPVVGIDSGGIGSGYFSRGQWHLLKKKWREEEEILARAAEAQGKERKALERAASETARVRGQADYQYEEQLTRLQNALAGAIGASTVATAISQANEAVRIAKAIQAEIDEEEAIAFLMLN
jgi:hypothetical protein